MVREHVLYQTGHVGGGDGAKNVFSYCRMCSLTVECVLLLPTVPSGHVGGGVGASQVRGGGAAQATARQENTFYSKRTHSIVSASNCKAREHIL